MRKLPVYLLLSTILAGMILSSCKKYEDGTSFGFTPINQRVEGDWTFASVVSTDADGIVLDETPDFNGYVLTFMESGKNGSLSTPTTPYTYASWRFSAHQDHIYITIGTAEIKYKILKLKSKNMWLRQENTDGSNTEIHFVQ